MVCRPFDGTIVFVYMCSQYHFMFESLITLWFKELFNPLNHPLLPPHVQVTFEPMSHREFLPSYLYRLALTLGSCYLI